MNGEPSCVNRELLTDTLRGKMGFDGFVVTDCTGAQHAPQLLGRSRKSTVGAL